MTSNLTSSLELAQRVAAAARSRAEEIGVAENIAVVDVGNNLMTFERMDGAWLGSIDIAINKAYTARAFETSTGELAEKAKPGGPLYGIHSAVNGYFEDQRISAEDAVRAYTAGGAFASFQEAAKGTLEAGKLADFVVLEGDPFADPARIGRCRVASTWIGGTCVYGARPRH